MAGYSERNIKEPLSESQRQYIKERIRSGEKLNPKKLAQELGVHHLTVSRTINVLLWLETVGSDTQRDKGNT